ncbi:uncharacterized protein LOC118364815 [Oncorhynchus keta]|uniref:uncharacterized protein LOC118364815 n=1 Tax=Oncorhynchus keta TaxID=8018 RepID=UPI0015FE555D|nr:uncharacterized protein LOC118364815 [Oncorhynchus keta]XP_035602432.1 uncharacterized protein LOC118364815 [Oncorhynchus keta]XP_035602433.1 uncharacterized protein LOC118364815 [Oncorhynchus keta]
MENIKTTQMLDLYEVAGIKGMLVADRRLDNQVKIYITYNKGRDWRFLQALATGLAGNNTHCFQPFRSLRLQLQKSENPCVSGSISTKASALGIIVATAGDQLRREHLVYLHQRGNEHCYGPSVFSQHHTARHQDDSSPSSKALAIGLCHVFHQLLCHKRIEALYLRWKWQGPLHSRLGVIKANSRARRGETAGSLPATTDLLYFIHCQSVSITTSIFEGNWDFVSGQGVLRFGVLVGWGAAHNCQNLIPDFQTHCQNFFKSPEFPHL